MRRDCEPCWIDDNGDNLPLKRVPFSDKSFDEDWIQTALHKTPEILPISELDPSFSPVVSLGREIINIDNLYVSPQGKITIVEAKLWRNPEATRKVIAQILDYAKSLNQMTYEQFEEVAKSALKPTPLEKCSLYELGSKAFKGSEDLLDEEQFIDAVQKNLKDARFMLLIVGDGIRENIEDMVELLHQQAQMLFTFGLVELQIFESEKTKGKLIVPQIVSHTNEIERAVVRVVDGEIKVSMNVESEPKRKGWGARRKLSEAEFFDEIEDEATAKLYRRLLQFADEIGAYPTWRSNSASIRMKDPGGSKQKLSLFVMETKGEIYFGWLKDQLEKTGIDPDVACEMIGKIANLFDNVGIDPKYKDSLSRSLTAAEIDDQFDAFTDVIRNTVERIGFVSGSNAEEEA